MILRKRFLKYLYETKRLSDYNVYSDKDIGFYLNIFRIFFCSLFLYSSVNFAISRS